MGRPGPKARGGSVLDSCYHNTEEQKQKMQEVRGNVIGHIQLSESSKHRRSTAASQAGTISQRLTQGATKPECTRGGGRHAKVTRSPLTSEGQEPALNPAAHPG